MSDGCGGCGGTHPRRTSLPDHCPCCAHPHDRHQPGRCAVSKCECRWPNGSRRRVKIDTIHENSKIKTIRVDGVSGRISR